VSDEELKELEAAHAATTPEWAQGDTSREIDARPPGDYVSLIAVFSGDATRAEDDTANRDFAVLAHRKLPALLAFVRRLLADNALLANDRLLDSDAAQTAVRLERERVLAILRNGIEYHGDNADDPRHSPWDIERNKAIREALAGVAVAVLKPA
jgi:hypothetical protein